MSFVTVCSTRDRCDSWCENGERATPTEPDAAEALAV
jgi:hypothetical protein